MGERLLVCLLALSMLLVGCVGQEPATTEEAEGETLEPEAAGTADHGDPTQGAAPVDPLFPNASAASLSNATATDWFSASGQASPEGAIHAFEWQVPSGAVVEDAFFSGETTVVLEGFPVLGEASRGEASEDGRGLESWGVFFFDLTGGEADLASVVIQVPYETRSLLGPLASTDARNVTTDPFLIPLGLSQFEEGDPIGIVIAAESTSPRPFGVALRTLDEDPGFDWEPPDDMDAFRTSMGDRAPIRLNTTGQGTGFQYASYTEFNFEVLSGFTAWTPAVEVTDRTPVDTRPGVSARELTLATSFPSERGWGTGGGFYFSDSAAGSWSADAAVHGQTLSTEGTVVETWAIPSSGLVTRPLFGWTSYGIEAEGAGPTDVAFNLELASVNQFEVVSFVQLDLGETISKLLGVTAPSETYTSHGLVDEQGARTTHAIIDEGNLRIRAAGGTTYVLQGLPSR